MFEGMDSVRIVPPGDANNDFVVGPADYTIWANSFGVSDPQLSDSDFNGDGSVDAADYTVLANNYGNGIDTFATYLGGDINGDGLVDAADYTVLASNYGQTMVGPAGASAAVPEPSALALAVMGLTGLLACGWRRCRRA